MNICCSYQCQLVGWAFPLQLLVINFSLYIVGLQSITYFHIYIYIYVCVYILMKIHAYKYIKKLFTKTVAKEAVLLPVKFSSDDDPGFRHGCGAKVSLPLTQAPQEYLTILPDFIGWCLICTNAISVQMQLQPCFGSFLYIPSSLLV